MWIRTNIGRIFSCLASGFNTSQCWDISGIVTHDMMYLSGFFGRQKDVVVKIGFDFHVLPIPNDNLITSIYPSFAPSNDPSFAPSNSPSFVEMSANPSHVPFQIPSANPFQISTATFVMYLTNLTVISSTFNPTYINNSPVRSRRYIGCCCLCGNSYCVVIYFIFCIKKD